MPATITLLQIDEHLSTTSAAFDALREMIGHSRAALIREREAAEKVALERAKKENFIVIGNNNPNSANAFHVLSSYQPVLSKYGGYLPRSINYGIILQLYALFEERGIALCKELKRRDAMIPVSFSDFGNREAKTIQIYLTKLCGIQYRFWEDIELLSQLRHRIIHNNGHVADKELIERIEKRKGLEIVHPKESVKTRDDDDEWIDFEPSYPRELAKPYIRIRNEYIDEIVSRVAGLFEQVFKEKDFGGRSPFADHSDEAALSIEGSGTSLKVTIDWND